jgi:hypothetical protein
MQLKEGDREEVRRREESEKGKEQLCLVTRQASAELAGGREVLELERTVSCCGGDQWWRTKLDLVGGEPFDDLHGSATLGTAIQGAGIF